MKRPSPVIRAATAAFRRIPPLRGRGRAEAIFHRWLSGSGLEDVIEVNGYSLEVSLDDIIGRSIYVNGIWERENTAVVRRLLSPGATVFDIGANTGYYTLLFSHLAGANGRVYAFEPVPSTRAALERNVARAATSSNVQILPVAVSDHPGEVLIHVAGAINTGASHVVSADVDDSIFSSGRKRAGIVQTLALRCVTGDEIWRERGRPAVDLVKIDIEGHELHALRGMPELLNANDNIVVLVEVRESFLVAGGASAGELFAFMSAHGFTSYDFEVRRGTFYCNNRVRSGELIIFTRRELS